MEGTCVDLQPFLGISFRLLGFDPEAEAKVRSLLIKGSGVDTLTTSQDFTHLIVGEIEYDDPACVEARNSGKTVVNSIWVNHSVEFGVAVDCNSVIYRPMKDLNGVPGSKSLILCLTGYQRQDREDIMIMTRLMGAQFSKPLVANKVTHLICYKFEGEKYELARNLKRIKLVNHRWLEDCLKSWELLPEENYCTCGFELENAESAAKDLKVQAENKVKNVTHSPNDMCRQSVLGNDLQFILRKEDQQDLTRPIKTEFPTLQHSGRVEKLSESEQVFIHRERLVSSETRTDSNLKPESVGKSSWRSPQSTKCGVYNTAEHPEKAELKLEKGSTSDKTVVTEINELISSNSLVARMKGDEKSCSSPLLGQQQNRSSAALSSGQQQNCSSATLSSGQLAFKFPSPDSSSERNEIKIITDFSARNVNARKMTFAKRPLGSKLKLNPVTCQKGSIFLKVKDENENETASASLPQTEPISNVDLQICSNKGTHVDNAIGTNDERNEFIDIDYTSNVAGKKILAPQINKRGRNKDKMTMNEQVVNKEKVMEKTSDGDTTIDVNLQLLLNNGKHSPSMLGMKEHNLSKRHESTPLADVNNSDGVSTKQKKCFLSAKKSESKAKADRSEVQGASAKNSQVPNKIDGEVISATKIGNIENTLSTTNYDGSGVKRASARKIKSIENSLFKTRDDGPEVKRARAKRIRSSTNVEPTVISSTKKESTENALSTTKGDGSEIQRASSKRIRASNKADAAIVSSAKKGSMENDLSTTKGYGSEVKRASSKRIKASNKADEAVVSLTKKETIANDLSTTKGDGCEVIGACPKRISTSNKADEAMISSSKKVIIENALPTTKGILADVKRANANTPRASTKRDGTVISPTENGIIENALSITNSDKSETPHARKTRSSAKEKESYFSVVKNGNSYAKEEETVKSIVRTGRKIKNSILVEGDIDKSKHSTNEETIILAKKSKSTRSTTEKENIFPTKKDEGLVPSTEKKNSSHSLKEERVLSTKRNRINNSIKKEPDSSGNVVANEGKRKRKKEDIEADNSPAEEEKKCFIVSGERSQRKEFQQMIKRLGGKCCKDTHKWCYEATHFIAPAPLRRTEKFFAAAASGRCCHIFCGLARKLGNGWKKNRTSGTAMG